MHTLTGTAYSLYRVVLGGYFYGFTFRKVFLGGFLSVAKYFLGHSEIFKSADPCQ